MKITMAQLNPTVGDLEGNYAALRKSMYKARQDNSDLLVLPELFISGYPPQDLLSKPWFIDRIVQYIDRIKDFSNSFANPGILLGAPWPIKFTGKGLLNSALLIHQGRIIGSQHKSLLPAYDVFDEARYFDSASHIEPIPFKGELLGINICEDAWNVPAFWDGQPRYEFDPIQILAEKGASLFINISASPFYIGKGDTRYQLVKSHAGRHNKSFIYVNQVGGNDELIFDGSSFALDARGQALAVFPAFQEHIATIDTTNPPLPADEIKSLTEIEAVYKALILGLKDYIRKCGFKKVVLGLSGGIDSAVTACLACAALGSDNVLGISMPSRFSSPGSVEDSRLLAANLGMAFKVIPIEKIYNSYIDSLYDDFKGQKSNIAEENLQARIRGNILMAFSNKFDYLLLSTGNKSEMALGYCTLYGDMSGGLSVIADLPKTMVYELSHFINRQKEIIPASIISKPPSAELRPGQVDQDDLPPYEILDQILHYYIEESYSIRQIISSGFDSEMVKWVVKNIDHNEYKRRQAAPALKVTGRAFGTGRRMPIAAKINDY
jgi:NAD+ synthase (glutamine-hydrolysing)